LILYYALENQNTSLKDKAIIYAALGYLILPIDAIPDVVPAAGFLDDIGVLIFAAVRVALSIDGSVKQKAKDKLVDLFGESILNSQEIKEVDKEIDGEDENDGSPVV
jgi:uncharacterized membrane protein YkvA (DUF1232 family)